MTVSASGSDLNVSGFTDGGSSVYLTTSTDNVGIGTSNPGYKLHVVGTSYFSGNATFAGGTVISSGINNSSGGITNAGPITGATGLTSSGTITFSGLGTGIVHSNVNGVLSSSALNLAGGGTEITGTLPVTNGGTGLTSVTTGQIIYASAANTFAALGIGSEGQVLTVSSGIPAWGSSGAGSPCATCIVNNPGSTQTITPAAATATGLVVKQAASGSVDVFRIESNDGSSTFFKIDSSGNVTLGNQTSSGVFTVSPTSTDPISISPVAEGVGQYTGTITSEDLTAARTWTFPNESGIICLASGNCSGTAASVGGSGTTNYLSRWSSTYGLTDSIIYDSGTNIGIGSTSPGAKLDLVGTFNVSGLATLADDLQVNKHATISGSLTVDQTVDFNSTLGVTGATTLGSTLDVTGLATFGGNVGIGTTSPNYYLDVRGAGSSSARFNFASTDSSAAKVRIGTTNGAYHFNVNSSGEFQIDRESGNSSIFSIQGDAPANLFNLQSSGGGFIAIGGDITPSTKVGDVHLVDSSSPSSTHGLALDVDSTTTQSIIFRESSNNVFRLRSTLGNGTYANNSLSFQTDTDSGSGATYSDLLTILQGGNIGIGTTNPLAALHIGQGTPNAIDGTSGDDLFVRDDLEVDGISTLGTTTFAAGTTTFSNGVLRFNSNGEYLYLQSQSDDGIHFALGTNGFGNNSMVITTQANRSVDHGHNTLQTNPTVFIHSATAPGTSNLEWGSLSFEGTGSGGGYFNLASGVGNLALSPASGNVGIGTTAPVHALEVNGNVALGQFLYHSGDTDTYFRFGTDQWQIAAGGAGFFDFSEGATDIATFNYNNADIDFSINGDTNNGIFFVDGALERIGIGTTTPSYTLDLVGEFNLTDAIRIAGDAGTSGYLLTSSAGGAMTWTDPTTLGSAFGHWENTLNVLHPKNEYAAVVDLALGGTSTASANIHLQSSGQAYFGGNVGIGTTDPSNAMVDLYGNQIHLYLHDTFGTGAVIRETGDNLVLQSQGGSISALTGAADGSTGFSLINSSSQTAISLLDNGGAIFNEQGNDADFRIEASGQTNAFFLQGSDGNIGIGSASPGYKLDVVGSLRLSTGNTNGWVHTDGTVQLASYLGVNYGKITTLGNHALRLGFNNTVEVLSINTTAHVGIQDVSPEAVFEVTGTGTSDDELFMVSSVAANDGDIFTVRRNGNVGIGSTTPIGKLNVSGAATGKALTILNETGDQAFLTASASGTTKFVLDRDGSIYWSEYGCSNQNCITPSARHTFYDYDIYAHNGGTISLNADGDIALNAGGNVGIGSTSPGLALDVVGSARFSAVGSGTYSNDLNLTSDGTLTTSSSDIRLKENLVELTDSEVLSKVLQLQTYTFDWKQNGAHDYGMVAQEVAQIFPQITFTNKTDGFMGINYSRVPTLLVSAVQEQQRLIDSLKLQVEGISGANAQSVGQTETSTTQTGQNTQTEAITLQSLVSEFVSFPDSVWTFVKEVVFTAQTKFMANVSFMKQVVFKDELKVNSNTSGRFIILQGTKKVRIAFDSQFSEVPTVYLSPQSQVVGGYSISSIDETGFAVSLNENQTTTLTFDWLALLSSRTQNAPVTVLEEFTGATEGSVSGVSTEQTEVLEESQTVLEESEPAATEEADLGHSEMPVATDSGSVAE